MQCNKKYVYHFFRIGVFSIRMLKPLSVNLIFKTENRQTCGNNTLQLTRKVWPYVSFKGDKPLQASSCQHHLLFLSLRMAKGILKKILREKKGKKYFG